MEEHFPPQEQIAALEPFPVQVPFLLLPAQRQEAEAVSFFRFDFPAATAAIAGAATIAAAFLINSRLVSVVFFGIVVFPSVKNFENQKKLKRSRSDN